MAEPEAIEIATARPDELVDFWRANEREALTEHWRFRVIWHEQAHEFTARSGSTLAGALRLRIAASLAHVELLFVGLHYRRSGVGRGLLARAEETANYYNCHKMTLETLADSPAQRFFEACGYKLEAVLPQHTFKLDVAVMRKFLL